MLTDSVLLDAGENKRISSDSGLMVAGNTEDFPAQRKTGQTFYHPTR
jgi:hypothetical protein